jgi:hypothetical protein
VVEFQGERRTVAEWASLRGDSTARPLIAQLHHMSMEEAMRPAHR